MGVSIFVRTGEASRLWRRTKCRGWSSVAVCGGNSLLDGAGDHTGVHFLDSLEIFSVSTTNLAYACKQLSHVSAFACNARIANIMCPAATWQSPLVNECIGISCNHAICVQNTVVRALRPSDRAPWCMNALSMDQIRRNLNLASA